MLLFLLFPNHDYSWDVLERTRVLWAWDHAPATHRYYWAHVLELPLARPFHAVFAGQQDPCRGLQAMESLAAGAILGLVYVGTRVRQRPLVAASVVALAGSAFAVWALASRGEERLVGALWLIGSMTLYVREASAAREPRMLRGALVGVVIGLAPLVHLTGLLAPACVALDVAVTGLARLIRRPSGPLAPGAIALGTATCTAVVGLIANFTVCHPGGPVTLGALHQHLALYHHGNVTWRRATTSMVMGDVVHVDYAEVARGLASTISAAGIESWWALPVFLLVAGASWLAAGALLVRDPARRRAAGLYLVVTGLWTLHFLHFEPENPESWLFLWLASMAFLGWSLPPVSPVLGLGLSGVLLVTAVFIVWHDVPFARQLARTGRPEQLAREFEALVKDGDVLLTDDPYWARVHRAFAIKLHRVILLRALLDEQPEPYVADEFVRVREVNGWLAAGRSIWCDATCANALQGKADLGPPITVGDTRFRALRSRLPEPADGGVRGGARSRLGRVRAAPSRRNRPRALPWLGA